MISEETLIYPLKPAPKFNAFDMARTHYAKWRGLVNFEDDVVEYLRHGFVVSRPTCFAMGKIINIGKEEGKPEYAWFIRIAVGDMMELWDTLPMYLPKIAFCRRGNPKIHIWPVERMVKVAATIKEKYYGV